MIALLVHIRVKPEYLKEFIAVSLENARNTHQEEGNLRFDVLQQEDEPNTVHLYEVYCDEAAMAAHREAEHYKRWRDAVEPWQQAPRTREKCLLLEP